jgi:hypothetical protein
MSVGVEALFTSALGLKSPWEVVKVELDTAKRRIDFEVACNAKHLPPEFDSLKRFFTLFRERTPYESST